MKYSFIALVVFLYTSSLFAQFSITGKVLDQKEGYELFGVNIQIEELKIGTNSDTNGEFKFKNIHDGTYNIRFSYIGHKTLLKKLELHSDKILNVEMEDGSVNLNEVVVTGNPLIIDPKELSQSTLSLSNLDLTIKRSSTIADMLNFQPGVSIRSNGIAASRPVIRGFSNNRVLILENGLRMGDLSNSSDDHGVSSDGGNAEKIEILRGPASLLYGSNAIGGVVNIISEAIPNYVSDKLNGTINLGNSSNNKEYYGNADVHYGISNFAFHGNYFNRQSKNYFDGNGKEVQNSDQKTNGYQFGISSQSSLGLVGLSFDNYKNDYGIPFNQEEIDTEGPIKIAMQKKDLRFLFENNNLNNFLSSISFKLGFQDYQHKEISKLTNEVGTEFGLHTFSADLSIKHLPILDKVNGVLGFWTMDQKYIVSGSEAFTPNANYTSFATYIFEQTKVDNFNLQFGLRYEFNGIKIPQAEISMKYFPATTKNYNSLSGSIGAVYNFTNNISFFSNIASAFRAPTIEELSSYAIHEATASFDIGNINLSQEKNMGVDFGFRLNKPNHNVELSFYYNQIVGFIYKKPSLQYYNPINSDTPFSTTPSGIPVFNYTQNDAIILGTELKAQHDFFNNLSTTVIFDLVRGYVKNTNENLPQMPPIRFSVEERYTLDNFWVGAIFKVASAQNKIAEFESPTNGYGLIDFYSGIKIITGEFVHMLDLKINNLLDQPYKDHLSATKNFAFSPGINASINYKFLF